MAEQTTNLTLSGLPADGESADASDLNTPLQQIVTELNKQVPLTKISADQAWTTYTVTWAGGSPTIGNGTLVGRYVKMGRMVTATILFVPGSTTTFGSGQYTYTVPFTSANASVYYVGSAYILDNGTKHYAGAVRLAPNANTVAIYTESSSPVGATNPFTWVNGDRMEMTITFEAAT